MSISLLIETQSEVKRLLIAGSTLASEDFRLKKLLPQMKKAGEGVQIFARVADGMEKVIEAGPESVSEKLLELGTIINAILYTQGQTGFEGAVAEVDTAGLSFPTSVPFRRLKPLIDALTEKGSGRLEIVRDAFGEGIINDIRLINPLISALEDNFPEIAVLALDILEKYGAAIVPVLKSGFDFKGGKGHSRRIELISRLKAGEEKEFYLEAAEKGDTEVKVSAVKALKDLPECQPVLLELMRDKKKAIKEACLFSLAHFDTEKAAEALFEIFDGKDPEISIHPVKISSSGFVLEKLIDRAQKILDLIIEARKSEKPYETFGYGNMDKLINILDCMEGRIVGFKAKRLKYEKEILEFLEKLLEHAEYLQNIEVHLGGSYRGHTAAQFTANNILLLGTGEAFKILDNTYGKYNNCTLEYAFEAALRVHESEYVFEHYGQFIQDGRGSQEAEAIFRVMEFCVNYFGYYRYVENSSNYCYGRVEHIFEHPEYTTLRPDLNINWDKRWLKTLIRLDELRLVCGLVKQGDLWCSDYLLKKLEYKFKKPGVESDIRKIVLGLLQMEYPEIMKIALKEMKRALEKAKTENSMSMQFYCFLDGLSFLSWEAADAFEAIVGDQSDKIVGRRILELVDFLRAKKLTK